jgi:hypothetical protein
MKTKKNILIILTVLLFTCQVQAEENHWQILKQFRMEKTPEAGVKYKEYMNSLGVNELIITARQCSEELDKVCPDSIFCERTTYALAFFFYTYIQKDGLKNIDMLLQEIEDRTRTNFWRASLIEFLGDDDWLELMETKQLYSIVSAMLTVISDKNEHARLRYEASETTRFILNQLEENNLLAEPVIQEKLKIGSQLQYLKKEVIDDKITLSDSYKQARAEKMKHHNRYAQTLLSVLNEPQLKPILQRGVLRGLQTSLEQRIDSAAQVRDALASAVRNYHKFDKDRWGYLLQICNEDLNLPDSNDIAQNMLNDMQSKLDVEQDKKKKNLIQNEIESLEWIIQKHKKQ